MNIDDKQKACAAQHFGLWAVQPRWMRSAVAAYNAGTMAAERKEREHNLFALDSSGIAVIPINGQMMKGESSFGGTSTVRTRRALRVAASDSDVKGIMLHIDSPGGTVAGQMDLARDITAAGLRKPLRAHADDMMASAAMWAGAQASFVSASPMTEVGSIGVVAMVEDLSGMAEQEGVKVHVVVNDGAEGMKGAFAPGTEITDEQLADLKDRINEINGFFVEAIEQGRSDKVADVSAINTGEDWLAEQAMQLGLIDAVMSFDEAISNLRIDIERREAEARRAGEARDRKIRQLKLS